MTPSLIAGVKRFWTPRDAELRLDGGYLSDPQSEYAAFLRPNSATLLEELDQVSCLVLLGEPGSGKTTALDNEVTRLKAASDHGAHSGDVVFPTDLRDYTDLGDLRSRVFQHPELGSWKTGTHRLTLALDSLDEALIEMRKLATRLASELRELPVDRLRLRIACRTADWPSVLEKELVRLWGENGVRVLEIAPLRRRDVLEIAAQRLGQERANEFVLALADRDAEAFAAKPGTLGLLISSFERSGTLPASQVELFGIGCRALCEEVNESRRSARRTGVLSADQRLAIAGRVAAATIFGGRSAVWTGVDRDVPLGDLRRADLVGDELTPTGIITVTEEILRDDVLSTGLFSARGPERLGWAHQTYGEFLAASWVARRALTAEQVLALVTVEDELGRKLVPQLHETTAWLASLRPDLFTAIMKLQPLVLLKSDVARADPTLLDKLVAALLDAAEQNTLPAPEFGQWLHYGRLHHPKLGEQLRRVIGDRARPNRVRDLALDIAMACKLREVAAPAANLALDKSEEIVLRATAARAVAVAGDELESSRLVPLALRSEKDDEADDLKGNALRATWRSIPPGDLFGALTRAKRPNLSGAYSGFLGELAEALSDFHVAPGLQWIDRIGHAGSPGERQLEAALVLRALNMLDDQIIATRLVSIVRRTLLRHEPLLDDPAGGKALPEILATQLVRRRLLRGLVDAAVFAANTRSPASMTGDPAPKDPVMLIRRELNVYAMADFGYFADDDFAFVLDSLVRAGESAEGADSQLAWTELARRMFDVARADHATAVLERSNSPVVHEVFGNFMGSVDLDGPEADAARRIDRDQRAEAQRRAERRAERERTRVEGEVAATPLPSAQRLADALRTDVAPEHVDDLPRRRWINVYLELVRDDKGEIPMRGRTGDARGGVAWRAADMDVRNEVIEAAAIFVESSAGPTLDPADGVHHHGYAWAGYVAFRLIAAAAPERLEHISGSAWKKWAETVALAEPNADTAEEQSAHFALAHRARGRSQGAFDEAVLGAVDYALTTYHWRVPTRVVRAFATTSLGDAVLARCLDVLGRGLPEAAVDPTFHATTACAANSPPENETAAEDKRQQVVRARQQLAMILVELLAALLQGGCVQARNELGQTLQSSASLGLLDLTTLESERAFISAHALLLGAADAGWGVISNVLNAAEGFREALFLRMAINREVPITNFRERLGLRGVAELFVALARAFPYESDPHHSGVYSPTARDNVTTWRRVVLTALEEWESPQAIAELQRVQAALPQYEWLAFSITRAREHRGRMAWRPVLPSDLFALANDRRRRLVRDGDELLELAVESLGRYQRELQGDLPAVVDLWDYSAHNQPRPRDEGHFADHLVRFFKKDLEGRGISVGSELVVRRGGKGRAPGLRTDIYVSAFVGSAAGTQGIGLEIASVVIEVKGSWNEDVLSAMRTQLVERYLAEHAGTRRGAYLVGDFTCDAWVDGEAVRRSRSLGGVAELQRRLDAQASDLSTADVRVKAVVLNVSLPA